jgi:hypothetical protein
MSLLERGRPPTEKMRAPQPDLRKRDPLELRKLRASLAGRVVGPKAANLGELASHFPEAVAPAIALPFGIFAQHAAAVDPPKAALDEAYRRLRAGEIDEDVCRSVVESVRRSIGETPLSAELKTEFEALLETTFGAPGSYGVFVRSDTNVEDLPGFTGAGLNLTVPHVVGTEAILAAIPRVWASPFGERPMKWRESLLERPEDVFTSVLLMKSVPVDKSGVLVTTDLIGRGDGYTVATAWGVGGAVDNEVAETLVLRPDGRTELVGEAKAPWRRRLRASGGVDWVPAAMGAVLTESDRRQLVELVARVDREFVPARGDDGRALPWDIEFGFLDGTLQLFQIRPLVERGSALATSVVRAARDQAPRLEGRVSLAEPPSDSLEERP